MPPTAYYVGRSGADGHGRGRLLPGQAHVAVQHDSLELPLRKGVQRRRPGFLAQGIDGLVPGAPRSGRTMVTIALTAAHGPRPAQDRPPKV